MKRSLLTRLRSNGVSYLLGALLILLALPFYQDIVMAPRGYGAVVEGLAGGHMAAYLRWIGTYPFQFVVYRFLLIVAFALLLSFPFSLSRIVVAQELMAQMEREEEQRAVQRARKGENGEDSADEQATDSSDSGDALPSHPWRGKGFAIAAAWAGLIGLILYIAGALLSTIYFFIVGHGFALHAPLPPAVGVISNIFSVMTNTVGIGLLALALLFFGASIARGGRNLWPVGWVLFGYAALVVAALFGGNALSVASTPAADQSAFTTPAILLFGLWMLWFGIMLVSLKPETS
jgi:hypothetical protein